jgi:hypothetical protein
MPAQLTADARDPAARARHLRVFRLRCLHRFLEGLTVFGFLVLAETSRFVGVSMGFLARTVLGVVHVPFFAVMGGDGVGLRFVMVMDNDVMRRPVELHDFADVHVADIVLAFLVLGATFVLI